MGFEAWGFEDLAKQLDEIGKIDDLAPTMLEAAAPILEKELKSQIHREAVKGYATGELERSIKANKPGENHIGHFVSVTAKGKDRNGTRNNEKLGYLNYGTSKQPAHPVIARSVKNVEEECLEVMQAVFNEAEEI